MTRAHCKKFKPWRKVHSQLRFFPSSRVFVGDVREEKGPDPAPAQDRLEVGRGLLMEVVKIVTPAPCHLQCLPCLH